MKMKRIEEISERDIARLNIMSSEELIVWAFENFGDRAAIGTSLQLTGTIIIDIASKYFKRFRVFTVDTLRLHPETYKAIEDTEKYYGIKIERYLPEREELKRMVERFGEYLFFMSKEKQEYCCYIRKVLPNLRALATLDVWITGLRRDQSLHRREIEKASVIVESGRKMLKLNPLSNWSIEDVWKYIREKRLPYNALFDEGYDSIGCIICSTPLVKGEPPRAGRWRWFNLLKIEDKKECGIHRENSGAD